MKKPNWTCVLFDLDGTIADSAPGITLTLGMMFEELGMPVPPPAELLKYVGPPLLDAFRDFADLSGERAQSALDIYRRFYVENGTRGVTIYPGIPGVLRAVHHSDLGLSLATSKPERPATRLLDFANLTEYFDAITGASLDETRSAKSDVVAEALVRLDAAGVDISNPVMVGDRHYDIEGAGTHGVPTIFVEWGYGAPEEKVGAIASVSSAAELRRELLG